MTLKCVSMKRTAFPIVLIISTLMLASCAHMPKLFWKESEGSGTQQVNANGEPAAPSEQALVVPPDLRGQVSVPMPNEVASVPPSPAQQGATNGQGAAHNQVGVAGTPVALDTRVYNQDAATVFSSVIDAMTSLNMPVLSVDSPSGTITTDWVRKDANSPNVFTPVMNLFGEATIMAERYRFVVRVLRLNTPNGVKTQLEIRTMGQVFENHHWINKPVKYKPSNDLFSAVGDQLARRAQAAAAASGAPGTATPAAASAPAASAPPASK